MDITEIMIIFIIVLLIVVFIFTHTRSLTEMEVRKLSSKRRHKQINIYFSFNSAQHEVNKEFKKRMKPNGKFYSINENLFDFPSIAAGLLKYKKHEWIIVAFEKNKKITLIWANKGPDRNSVALYISVERIIDVGINNFYDSVLLFHNHPNPNPNYYDFSTPSKQDKTHATNLATVLNNNSINLVDFVCERGTHHQYYSSYSDTFIPLDKFTHTINRKNGKSKSDNLFLHLERLF